MATQSNQQASGDDYEEMFPNFVYQIPGLVLILLGFGGLVFMTLP